MKPANFAPVYACVYPKLAEIARSHGYALAAHGSLARDFDLVCIPWADTVSDPQSVVDQIVSSFAIEQAGGVERKKHGRIAYTLSFSFGECRLDLSFMPKAADVVQAHILTTERAVILEAIKWLEVHSSGPGDSESYAAGDLRALLATSQGK